VGLAGTHRLGASYARPQSGANPETISSRVSLVLSAAARQNNPRKRRSSAREREIRELRNAEQGARLRATRNYRRDLGRRAASAWNAIKRCPGSRATRSRCAILRGREAQREIDRRDRRDQRVGGPSESTGLPTCQRPAGLCTRVQPLSFLSRIAVEVALEVAVEAEWGRKSRSRVSPLARAARGMSSMFSR
jgi:hypothetical protein